MINRRYFCACDTFWRIRGKYKTSVMKMASKYDCGNEDTPADSLNLINIVREYPAKYICSKVLDHKEPVPTV